MKIVVTGAAGGIGSRLSKKLHELGHSLVLIDDLSGGFSENLGDLAPALKVVDVAACDLFSVIDFGLADVVIHLAGKSSLAECESDPSRAYMANLVSTVNAAEYAKKVGAKLIFSSTSAVYEGLLQMPLREDMEVSPHLVYPTTKRAAELHLEGLMKTFAFPSLIFRFFNVFGENQNAIRKQPPFVNYLHRELSAGRLPVIYAPAEQTRDYIYIDDVIDLMIKSLEREYFDLNGTYNVCTGNPMSVGDILKAVAEGAAIESVEYQQGDPDHFWHAFEGLRAGAFPISGEVVRNEVLKSSLGSLEKVAMDFNWKPSRDVASEISKFASNLKRHGEITLA